MTKERSSIQGNKLPQSRLSINLVKRISERREPDKSFKLDSGDPQNSTLRLEKI